MGRGEPLAPSTRRPDCAELRRRWDAGRRAEAIRSALDDWDAVSAGSDDDLRWLERTLRACGLPVESLALQAGIARRSGRDWAPFVRSVLGSGDPWWARALLDEADGGGRELSALRIEVELAVGDAGPLIAAWERQYRDPAAAEAAVRWWVRAGRADEAERLAADAGLAVWRARFLLWRNDPAAARRLLDGLPPSAPVRCLSAIAAVLEGRLADAEPVLRSLLDGEEAAEAWGWLATLLRKQRRFAEAVHAADQAKAASSGPHLAAQLERELAIESARRSSARQAPGSRPSRLLRAVVLLLSSVAGRATARRDTVGALPYAHALYPLGVKPDDDLQVLESVLERFAGNHGVDLTVAGRGALRSYRPPPDPGQLGSMIRLVLWTRGADAARALFRELAPSVEGHPHFRNYHGELELWMGAYEDAARIFREVVGHQRHVRWAWIGLGASAMLQGDLRDAQNIWARGVSLTGPGPTLHVYRGECYRRQGELGAARRELTTALRDKPGRLSARINLALLEGAPADLQRVESECRLLAPLLMEELGGTTAKRLEQVLAAMRGNRSSSAGLISYHLWGRVWRATA